MRYQLSGPALIAVAAWGEWQNRKWSRTVVGAARGRSEAVVILGCRNRRHDANFINRWRVRSGLRSIDPAALTRLIFSGGATTSTRTEASILADYAVNKCGYSGEFLVEERSKSTWENIENVIPLLHGVDRIKIISQPAHALKARVYLRRQHPALARKLVRAADYRAGEWIPLKPLLAAYGLWSLRAFDAEDLRPL